jgi:hypothetical protein
VKRCTFRGERSTITSVRGGCDHINVGPRDSIRQWDGLVVRWYYVPLHAFEAEFTLNGSAEVGGGVGNGAYYLSQDRTHKLSSPSTRNRQLLMGLSTSELVKLRRSCFANFHFVLTLQVGCCDGVANAE